MFAIGGGYKLPKWQVDAGLAYVYEGTRDVGRDPPCNPTISNRGCSGSGMETPIGDRIGPDPVNPIVELRAQNENPFNQGTYSSHYFLLALGVSTYF
jgi:hypothetical protein